MSQPDTTTTARRLAFDPRQAALYHAGQTVDVAASAARTSDPAGTNRVISEATNAIVCGLVYVGDAIRSLERIP